MIINPKRKEKKKAVSAVGRRPLALLEEKDRKARTAHLLLEALRVEEKQNTQRPAASSTRARRRSSRRAVRRVPPTI